MKNMKRLIAVMMVLAIALCVVACAQPQDNGSKPATSTTTKPSGTTTQPSGSSSQNDPEPTHFVKVVDQDGNPVSGVIVSLCDDFGCYDPASTGEDGIAVFYKEGLTGAKAVVFRAPAGYTFSEEYTLFGDSNTITITITAEPTHSVKVVDQDGNPVSGVIVSLCDDFGCYDPASTGEDGIAVFYKEGLTGAKAVVFRAPAGYTFSEEYTMFGDSNFITITITAIAD